MVDDIKQGLGRLTNIDNKWSYQGAFKNDQFNGFGVITWDQSGDLYKGFFVKNMK